MKQQRLKAFGCAVLAAACLSGSGARAMTPALVFSAYGFIDRSGEVIVPPACDRASYAYRGDWVSLGRDRKEGFLNLRTKQFTGLIFEGSGIAYFREPLFARGPEPVLKDGKYGYVDEAGETVIPFRYEGANQFDEHGLALVKFNGKFGYIDTRGDFVIPPRFDGASEFNDGGFASVTAGRHWGAIDRRGRLVIPAKFDTIDLRVSSTLVVVGAGGRMGAVDTQGRIVVPIKFGQLRGFGPNGLAAASLDADPSRYPPIKEHWGFIDRSGSFVIQPVYYEVSDFEDEQHRKELSFFSFRAPLGLAAVSSDSDGVQSTTYIDARGKPVIRLPPGIIGNEVFRNGLIRVFDTRKSEDPLRPRFGIFDPANPVVPTAWFSSVGDFEDGDLAPVLEKALSPWGYVDRTGTFVIKPRFAGASGFTRDGLASVQTDNPASGHRNASFIDRTGRVRLHTSFDDLSSFGDSGFARITVNRGSGPIELAASQCAPSTH